MSSWIVDFGTPDMMDSCRTDKFLSYMILDNNIFIGLLFPDIKKIIREVFEMGFLNLFKKDKPKKKPEHQPSSLQIEWEEVGDTPESDTTEDDTNLPFGWVTHNKEFIEPIEKEFSYFMNIWIDARNKSPKELYSALKSFVRYMEDVKRLCSSKGKNFECWCNTILIKDEYFNIRKEELEDLSTKWVEMQKEYELKQKLLSTLPSDLMDFLNDNNGILQSDVYKHFNPIAKLEIQSLLYEWGETGKINREKSGRSYKITVQL